MNDLYADDFIRKIHEAGQAENYDDLCCYLMRVEEAITELAGDDPFIYKMTAEDKDKICDLLGTRKCILDYMFTYSDMEIRQLKNVNDTLFDLRKQMFVRTASLFRTLLGHGLDISFDHDYEVVGTLRVDAHYTRDMGDFGTIAYLENDAYYLSDFPYMIALSSWLHKLDSGLCWIDKVELYPKEGQRPDMSDKELVSTSKSLTMAHPGWRV